jgi:hypothetical protein
LITEDIPVAAGTISLTISRGVAEGVHEDLDLVNYNRNPIKFNLEIPETAILITLNGMVAICLYQFPATSPRAFAFGTYESNKSAKNAQTPEC